MTERLVELGRWLQAQRYAFTAVTPATHARVLPRLSKARSLRDIFGWSAPFAAADFPLVANLLREADACEPVGELLESRVRFASAGRALFMHSAYPTLADDSVFFGPDTYRFLRALQRFPGPYGRLIDVGTGSGVAGISLAPDATETVLTDVSSAALCMAHVNAELAATPVTIVRSDLLAGVTGSIDTLIANPPFLADRRQRKYRDGGGHIGTGLGLSIVEQALARLAAHGRLLLYTGAPIVDGVDVFKRALDAVEKKRVTEWSYEEIDADIFGEELDQPGYEDVERIAAVVLTVRVVGGPRVN